MAQSAHDHALPAQAEVFCDLEEADLAALAGLSRRERHRAGERLFAVGDEARSLLVIGSGLVALTIPVPIQGRLDDVTLEEKGPGAVLAWSALVPPHRLTLGATVRADVELHAFERAALKALLAERPGLHLRLTVNLNRIIASRVTMLEALVARDVQRLAAELRA